MRNTVIDYLRRRYMKKDKMDIYTCCEEEGRNTVEEDYYYKELRVAHRKMVKQLSEKCRQAYILYFLQGYVVCFHCRQAQCVRTFCGQSFAKGVQGGASGGGRDIPV